MERTLHCLICDREVLFLLTSLYIHCKNRSRQSNSEALMSKITTVSESVRDGSLMGLMSNGLFSYSVSFCGNRQCFTKSSNVSDRSPVETFVREDLYRRDPDKTIDLRDDRSGSRETGPPKCCFNNSHRWIHRITLVRRHNQNTYGKSP